jgi:catecholate siderophore receptor
MSHDGLAGRPFSLTSLRVGTALALILGVVSAPAMAQSGPETTSASEIAPNAAPEGAASPDVAPEPEVAPDDNRERVYVLGRRAPSSVATINAEDAPQVVNVISGETLAEQGVASLEQALRNVPGITTQIGEGGVMSGDQFFIRGLSAKNDVFTDGLRDFGVFTRDSFNYGQVEVFKGPSASAFGRGAAGGGINTTSKTPYLENGGDLSVAGGDADYGRATGDWNQVLAPGVAVRIAGMVHHNENTGRDRIYSDRWGIAPSIGFGLDGDTSFTLAYLHQDEEKVPDYGIPTASVNGINVPITAFGVPGTNFYGFDADIDDTIVDTFTARLRHVVNDWLTLTSDTKYGAYQRYSQYTPVSCRDDCVAALTDGDDSTIPLVAVGGPGPYDQDTYGVQNITTATITAPIGGLRNELIAGFDVSWQTNERHQHNYAARVATKDLFNPSRSPNPTISADLRYIRESTGRDVSIFANDRLWFTEQWSISAGVRIQRYEVDQDTTTFDTTSCNGETLATAQTCYSPVSSNTDFVTPQVSVMFEPTAGQAYYVTYSTSAKPPGVSVANADTLGSPGAGGSVGTSDLDPEENTNIEAGARWSLFDKRLNLQGSIFEIRKDNAKEIDPDLNAIVTSGDSQRVRGIELGAAGAITDQWSINANYTWLDAKTTDSGTTANIGNTIAFTPEQAASLWTTYNFTGGLAGLEVGGGVTYQDKVYLNAGNTGVSPSYTTLDGLISYGFDRYRVSLNAYNLTDELYFAQVHGNRVTPGQGRTFIATLGVVF